jgi:hypothetical protein
MPVRVHVCVCVCEREREREREKREREIERERESACVCVCVGVRTYARTQIYTCTQHNRHDPQVLLIVRGAYAVSITCMFAMLVYIYTVVNTKR